MTHIHPGGQTRPAPPLVTIQVNSPIPRQPGRPPLGIDRHQLRGVIAARCAALGALEAEMVSKCEEAAAKAAPRGVRLDDRTTWDRAMWERYLSAAAAMESDYLPQMLRLHAEIDRLERLLLLPPAPEAPAA
jgi:hypothetical protein